MSKKHFTVAAEMVKHLAAPREHRILVASQFARLFRQFNPDFDESRFLEACHLGETEWEQAEALGI